MHTTPAAAAAIDDAPTHVVTPARTIGTHRSPPAFAPSRAMTPAHGTPAARTTTPAHGIQAKGRAITPTHGFPAQPPRTTPAHGTSAHASKAATQSSPSAPTLLGMSAPDPTASHGNSGEPAWTQVAQRNRPPTPVPVAEPYVADKQDESSLKSKGFLGGLFTRKKKPVAAIAAKADKIEFTDRMPKLPANTLYSEQDRRTELAFPAPETVRKRPVATRGKRPVRKATSDGPARFCDRCWRRLDSSGVCKTCPTP